MNVKRREGIWTPSIGKGVHPTHKVIQMTRKKEKKKEVMTEMMRKRRRREWEEEEEMEKEG